jgi:predicted RNase H-like HicB family nuclease
MTRQLTAIIERERDGYVSLCPELDIASQGNTIEEARQNLCEAVELFFECASPQEIDERLHDEVKEFRIGTLQSIIRQSGVPRHEFEP